MRKKDTFDVLASALAIVGDTCAILGGFMLATYIRFNWLPLFHGRDVDLYTKYGSGASIATLLFLFVFRSLVLYVRPQVGTFGSKIPRLIRATGLGILLSTVLAFIVKNYAPFSSLVLLLSFFTISVLVILQRYILFRLELHFAKHSPMVNRVLILGTDEVAAHLKRALAKEPRLRSEVVGFLRTDLSEPYSDIPSELIKGTVDELHKIVKADAAIDQLILTNPGLGHQRIVDIILFCERNLITFNMVPDLFRILTGTMDVQTIEDIPLLGVSRWPLDMFWNRVLKKIEDVVGAVAGLIFSAPFIAVAAVLIKKSSPGSVFYRQERYGEKGKVFNLYKLRTMSMDAEAETGPVFAAKNDPRITKIGTFLRRYNLDELPQLWNVLKGDMSLVGPRPERPHFVEQFKEDISRYMWRHVSKPGMTGWAQVNGLRGNTSIEERIKYDLYYLENWSLAFDFKIIVKTLFTRENAY